MAAGGDVRWRRGHQAVHGWTRARGWSGLMKDPTLVESLLLPDPEGVAPQGVELRHLRYFVAVADAGTFTHAAKQMFIAQPTLSQQIRRLEEMVGAPLLQRRREGVRPTKAGSVLLEESRAVLSLVDHGVSRT